MRYRELGKTGIKVSEIGLGGEWLEKQSPESVKEIVDHCAEKGINILDCWMSEPEVRSNIGAAIKGSREKWIIEGHIGSTWQNGQYVRTRELAPVKASFEDLLTRMQTDYIDLGMMHFIDEAAEFERVMKSEYFDYVRGLKKSGVIRHIGMSSHSPAVAKMAAEQGEIEVILFSINPAFDMLPPTEDINDYFKDDLGTGHNGIDPLRAELYRVCEERGVALTVMKPYAGGRLFNPKASPFGVALTPVQCLHYALTRPAVASVMVGYSTIQHVDDAVGYETATDAEKDYASVLAGAPVNPYRGQCTYCGHCAPCPSGIDIPMMNKLYDLAAMHESAPDTLRAHYEAMSRSAKDCISCHACEKRCPFGVKIADKMAQAREMFK